MKEFGLGPMVEKQSLKQHGFVGSDGSSNKETILNENNSEDLTHEEAWKLWDINAEAFKVNHEGLNPFELIEKLKNDNDDYRVSLEKLKNDKDNMSLEDQIKKYDELSFKINKNNALIYSIEDFITSYGKYFKK